MTYTLKETNGGAFNFAAPHAWRQGRLDGLVMDDAGLSPTPRPGFQAERTWSTAAAYLEPVGVRIAAACCNLIFVLDPASGRLFQITGQSPMQTCMFMQSHLRNPHLLVYGHGRLVLLDRQPEWYLISYDFTTRRHGRVLIVDQEAIARPVAMAVDEAGTVFLAEQDSHQVLKIDAGGQTLAGFGGDRLRDHRLMGICRDEDGHTYVLAGDADGEILLRFGPDGRHQADPRGGPWLHFPTARPGFHPIGPVYRQGRFYFGERSDAAGSGLDSGSVLGFDRDDPGQGVSALRLRDPLTLLTLDPDGNLLLYFAARRELVFHRRQHIYTEGTWLSPILDSRDQGTHWHLLGVTADLPEQTVLDLRPLVSDRPEDLQDLTRVPPLACNREVLFPGPAGGPRGRYARLLLRLRGHGPQRPVLHQLRVAYPRMSYLRYLPAVYSEQNGGGDFPERFLCLFESFFEEMERKIDGIPARYDARTTDGDGLRLLAAWLGMAVDADLDDADLRARILGAPQRNRLRGTLTGIRALVAALTSTAGADVPAALLRRPLIVERFRLDAIRQPQVLPGLNRLFGEGHAFLVLLDPAHLPGPETATRLAAELQHHQPAHTTARVSLLYRQIVVGGHNYLGINTYVGAPKRLGADTVLIQAPEVRRDQQS